MPNPNNQTQTHLLRQHTTIPETVRSDPLQENAGANRQPEDANPVFELGEERQHPRQVHIVLLEAFVLIEGESGVQESVHEDDTTAHVVDPVQVLLDDDVDVNVAGHVVGPRKDPPRLGEVPRDEQGGDDGHEGGNNDLGLAPVRAPVEPQFLPPLGPLNGGQRETPVRGVASIHRPPRRHKTISHSGLEAGFGIGAFSCINDRGGKSKATPPGSEAIR